MQGQQVLLLAGTAPHLELCKQCRSAANPLRVCCIGASGITEVRSPKDPAERAELAVVHGSDDDVAAVGGGKGLVGDDRLVRCAPGPGGPLCCENAAGDVGEARDAAVEQRGVDVLPRTPVLWGRAGRVSRTVRGIR